MKAPRLLDGECQTVMDKCGAIAAVPWAMMAGLLYHHASTSILSDPFFDKLMRLIDEKWDELDSNHKHIIGRDAPSTGSLFHLNIENYPNTTRAAAMALVRDPRWGVSFNDRDRILRAPFRPPEYCWDTYRYSGDRTFRQCLHEDPKLWERLGNPPMRATSEPSALQLFLMELLDVESL